jgi:hypothetical protein
MLDRGLEDREASVTADPGKEANVLVPFLVQPGTRAFGAGEKLHGRQRDLLQARELAHPVLPQPGALGRARLGDPSHLGIGRIAHRHAPVQLLHDKEGRAEQGGIRLEPERLGHRRPSVLVQDAHDAVLLLEEIVRKDGVGRGLDPHDAALLDPASVQAPARVEQDRLVRQARAERIGEVLDADVPCAWETRAQPPCELVGDHGEVANLRRNDHIRHQTSFRRPRLEIERDIDAKSSGPFEVRTDQEGAERHFVLGRAIVEDVARP